MSDQPANEATTEAVPCVCGAQLTRPYPNDTGDHSTTECPAQPADETTIDLTAAVPEAVHQWAREHYIMTADKDGDLTTRKATWRDAPTTWGEAADALAPVIRAERAAAWDEGYSAAQEVVELDGVKCWAHTVMPHGYEGNPYRAEAERRGESNG